MVAGGPEGGVMFENDRSAADVSDDDALLADLQRSRPGTVLEAVTQSHRPAAQVRAALYRLHERGLIVVREDALRFPHPADRVAEAVTAEVLALRRSVGTALAEIERQVAGLPAMVRRWSVGEASVHTVPVVTLHGPLASENLWFDFADHTGGTLQVVLPDVARFVLAEDDSVERLGRAFAAKDAVQGIIPAAAIKDPADRRSVARYERNGIEFRVLDAPPSWFWVDGEHVALPSEWGERRPASVLGIRNAASADLARAYFALLWRQARPLDVRAESWTPLLRLMRQGITLETASRMLGVNPRTGRRRVSAAMAYYDVSTLFALGAAWGADTHGTPAHGSESDPPSGDLPAG